MDKSEKLKEIAQNCNVVQALSVALNEGLRNSLLDLSAKIDEDNYGTRSHKDGALRDLVDGVNVVNETGELADTMMEVFKSHIN